jgi:adenylosuccinate lyase
MKEEPVTNLFALSPLDGRYRADVAELTPFFSEAALFRYRVMVEVEYLIFLSRVAAISFVPPLPAQQQATLRTFYSQFSEQDARDIADWDRRVNHDVKAVEYWLRERLTALGLAGYVEAVHFALTSEDVNNLAYGLIARDARNQVLKPALDSVIARLRELALQEAETPILARTHGQPATPTTMGKEIAVYAARLRRATEDMQAVTLSGKLNGATGTFAAHLAAYPTVDWIAFSRAFVRSLDLEPMMLTTQIEPHDTLVTLCDAIKRVNTILIDLCQDFWRYISDDYLVQAPRTEEVGSSTMPHKINPIDFENSEGNLGVANALLEFFGRKLPISRLQRDLSDSTTLRNLGVAYGHTVLAYGRILKGVNRLAVNHAYVQQTIQQHPEVLAEAFQTILRRSGYPEPYEALKQLTRGRRLTLQDFHQFVETLQIEPSVKEELLRLVPEAYVGVAPDLARLLLQE